MIATPFAVVTAWSVCTPPERDTEFFDEVWSTTTVREGDATAVAGQRHRRASTEMDFAVAALDDAPWVESNPAQRRRHGVGRRAAPPDLDIGLRSTRWGTRSIEPVRVTAAGPWASFAGRP